MTTIIGGRDLDTGVIGSINLVNKSQLPIAITFCYILISKFYINMYTLHKIGKVYHRLQQVINIIVPILHIVHVYTSGLITVDVIKK